MRERTSPPERRVRVLYCLIQMGFWGMLGAFCGYSAAVVQDRGFSSGQAGVFLALGCLAGMVSQPLLGGWADRHPAVPLKRILACLMVPSVALNLIFYFTRPGFFGTALIFLLLGAMETNSFPLLDSMAMQYIDTGVDVPYSLGRGLGSFSYAVICVLVGQQTARLGIQTALLTHAALQLLLILFIVLFPTFRAGQPSVRTEDRKPHSPLYLLRSNRPFTLMLLGGFFGMMAVMPIANFMVNLVREQGGGSGALGVGLFLMAASELPGAFLFQFLRRKFRNETVLLIALAFMAVRPALVLLSGSLAMLLAVQPFQMLGYGIFTPANVYYANENVAVEDRIQGQSLKMVMTSGMGTMMGNLLSGYFIDWGGVRAMLWMCICSGCAGLCLGLLAVRARRRTGQ